MVDAATKLMIIICDYHLGSTISTNNGFPNKISYLSFCDTAKEFGFDPFNY